MNIPKLSFCITCMNRLNQIKETLPQNLRDNILFNEKIEFIVVDGASTDGSLEIIREYEGRISTIISEPDHGMYEAINKGIRVATGDVIGLLHSDDFFYDPIIIEEIIRM